MKRSLASVLVPTFIQRRYAAKFVVSFALVLLAIGIVGAAGYTEVNSTIEQDTRESLESQATMQADSLSEWTQRMGAQTRTVAQMDDVNDGNSRDVRRELNVAKSSGYARGAAGIHVVDLETETVVATSTGSDIEAGAPLNQIDDPWASSDLDERVASRNVWVSNGSYDSQAVNGRTVVAFATRAADANRAVILEGSVDVRVGQLHQGEVNQSTAIVNGAGEYVLQPQGQSRTRIMDSEQRAEIQRAIETGDVQFSQDDTTVYAYAPVDGVGSSDEFVAVTSAPRNDAYAVRDTVGHSVFFIVAVAVLTLGLVGIVLGRQTVAPLTQLRSRAQAMEDGDLDVDLETERIDEIGQLYGAFDGMRESLRDQIRDAQMARDEAQAERERVRKINSELELTAADYSNVMEQAAAGDLTARMRTDADNDAMASIAMDFNEMLEELETTVGELNAFAAEVATASEQVTASSEEVRSASEQIAESVQEISAGAEHQNESLRSVDEEMSDLSTSTEEIAVSSNEVADIAERTATTGRAGREAATAAIDEMHAVETESARAVEEISKLETEVEQIDELIDRIQEIADQTNMLALNANIEASRSAGGEGDGGFGVVAQEVKVLSEDAKEAATEVEERLESIREQTRRSAQEVEQTSEGVDEASDQVADAVDALEEIAEFAQETHTGVQEISAATEQQAASTQEVVAMVDEATSISEQTTVESENVAAAAEEQTTALTEVSRSASELSGQAAQLSEALDRFETDAKLDSGPGIRRLEGGDASNDALPGPELSGDGPAGAGDLDAHAVEDFEAEFVDAFEDGFEADSLDETGDSDPAEESVAGEAGLPDGHDELAFDDLVDGQDGLDRSPVSAGHDGEEDIDAFDPSVDAADFGADRAAAEHRAATASDDGVERHGSEASSADDAGEEAAGGGDDDASEDEPELEGRKEPEDADAVDEDVPTDGGRVLGQHGDGSTSDATPIDRTGTDVFGPGGPAEGWDEDASSLDGEESPADGDEDAAAAGEEDDGATVDDEDGGAEAEDEVDGAVAEVEADAATSDQEDAATSDDTESPADGQGEESADSDLTDLHGVGDATAASMREAGVETVADVREASQEELADVDGIGTVRAAEIKDNLEE